MKNDLQRNWYIDVIRGLCILFVILLHLNIHFALSQTYLKDWLPPKVFTLLFWSGYYGVVIFFSLSGFLITNSVIKKWGGVSNINIKTFYQLRAWRILPPLILLLIVLSTLHFLKLPSYTISSNSSLPQALFAALTFHINWLEIKVGYLPANWDVLWTISVEEFFYLLFPWFCIGLKSRLQIVTLIGFLLVLSPIARTLFFPDNELGDRNHFAYLDSFVLGSIAAVYANKINFSHKQINSLLLIGFALITPVMLFRGVLYKHGITEFGLNVTMLSLGISLILIYFHQVKSNKTSASVTLFSWLKNMGVYSYEIYLSHMFVVISGSAIYRKAEISSEWLVPYAILLILLSYFLGKYFYLYFSEPLNNRARAQLRTKLDA